MKYFQRYFSLLCVLALLFTVFSITANAESSIAPDVVYFERHVTTLNDWSLSKQNINQYSSDSNITVSEVDTTGNYGIPANTKNFYYSDVFKVYMYDGEVLFKKGENTTISLYNVFNRIGINHPNGFYYADDNLQFVKVLILYMDGSAQTITDTNFTARGSHYDIEFDFKPSQDVKAIEVHTKRGHALTTTSSSNIQVTFYAGMSGSRTTFSAVQSSEESGLLKGIIDWLKGIKDGITNLFNSIAELPSKIWSFIENGLKSLFMPSEDFIVNFKADIEEMLSNKLGAVWQVIDITLESWDSISANDTANTINIPVTSIPLPEGNSFSFGGYDVQIVPNGFEFIVTIIKTVVGIVCTILFINGLRKKYDEVMGVEQ